MGLLDPFGGCWVRLIALEALFLAVSCYLSSYNSAHPSVFRFPVAEHLSSQLRCRISSIWDIQIDLSILRAVKMVILNLWRRFSKLLLGVMSLRISIGHQMVYKLAISTNGATGNLLIAIWWHLPTQYRLFFGLVLLCESFNLLFRSLLVLQIDVSVLWTLRRQDCRRVNFLAQEKVIMMTCTDHGIAHIVFWINNRRDFVGLFLHHLSCGLAEIV